MWTVPRTKMKNMKCYNQAKEIFRHTSACLNFSTPTCQNTTKYFTSHLPSKSHSQKKTLRLFLFTCFDSIQTVVNSKGFVENNYLCLNFCKLSLKLVFYYSKTAIWNNSMSKSYFNATNDKDFMKCIQFINCIIRDKINMIVFCGNWKMVSNLRYLKKIGCIILNF